MSNTIDFISLLPGEVGVQIFKYLDDNSLKSARLVSTIWNKNSYDIWEERKKEIVIKRFFYINLALQFYEVR